MSKIETKVMPEVASELDDCGLKAWNIMASVKSKIDGEAELSFSLAKIHHSIKEFAAEQHEMFNEIRELRSEFFAMRSKVAGNEVTGNRSGRFRQESSGCRNYRSYCSQSIAVKAESSTKMPNRSSRPVGLPSCSSQRSHNMALAAEASKVDTSSLDPTWPGSLHLRPAIQALHGSLFAPFTTGKKTSEDLSKKFVNRVLTPESYEFKEPPGIILPASRLRTTLDLIGLLLLAWDLIVTPVQLAWNLEIKGWLYTFAVIVSTFWTLDMLTFFRTAYYTRGGELETRPRILAMHYLSRAFAVDLLIVLCDWFNLLAVGLFPSGLNLLRAMKLTRLLRILRMIKLAQFERVDDFVNSWGVGPAMFESIKIFTFTMWLTHVMSCVWFAIGKLDTTDTGWRWLDSSWADDGPSFADSKFSYQYTSALQWALTSMLSGTSAILPLNSAEQCVSCACILVGLMVQAFVVSVLSSSAVEQKAEQRNQTAAISEMNRFCSNHKVSADFGLLARSQIRASFFQRNRAALEIGQVEGLQRISPKLRMSILREVFEPQLSRHALFTLWSQADQRSFSRLTGDLMSIMYAQRGHDIFLAGDAASGMYLLSNGEATYSQISESSKVMEDTCERMVVDTWVCKPALWIEWSHVGTMEAVADNCEVNILHVQGFLELVANTRMVFKQFLRSYAIMYHERATQSVPPLIPWPSDTHTHGTNFVQMLTSMEEAVRNIATSLALDYAMTAGVIDEAQWETLKREVDEGKALIVISRMASSLSVQRVVSVARIFVSRSDHRIFFEIGHWSDDKFVLKVQIPGAKQRGSEDIFTTIRRVADRLEPVVGNITCSSTHDNDEILVSKKVNLKTHYFFVDAFFVDTPNNNSSITKTSMAIARDLGSVAEKPRQTRVARFITRSSAVVNDLENRMLAGNELFRIVYSDDSEKLGMWINEQEQTFLKSADGMKFVEGMAEKGVLNVAAAIDQIEDQTRVSFRSISSLASTASENKNLLSTE